HRDHRGERPSLDEEDDHRRQQDEPRDQRDQSVAHLCAADRGVFLHRDLPSVIAAATLLALPLLAVAQLLSAAAFAGAGDQRPLAARSRKLLLLRRHRSESTFGTRAQMTVRPPSTSRLWPATMSEAREARNTTAPTISSGCPTRPAGIASMIQSR